MSIILKKIDWFEGFLKLFQHFNCPRQRIANEKICKVANSHLLSHSSLAVALALYPVLSNALFWLANCILLPFVWLLSLSPSPSLLHALALSNTIADSVSRPVAAAALANAERHSHAIAGRSSAHRKEFPPKTWCKVHFAVSVCCKLLSIHYYPIDRY